MLHQLPLPGPQPPSDQANAPNEIDSGIKIISAWTKAGIGSCVHISGGGGPQEEILFDLGICSQNTLVAKTIFITHGHTDHIGAAVSHARMKTLMGANSQSTYYVPEACLEGLREAKVAYEKLDQSDIRMNIIAVKPGDVIQISKSLKCKVFATKHRIDSQGYVSRHYTL